MSGLLSASNLYDMTNSIIQIPVRITFNYGNLHDMTNSIIEIPEVGVHLRQWWVTTLSVSTAMRKWLHALPSYPILCESQAFSQGSLTSKHKNVYTSYYCVHFNLLNI